MKIFLPTKPNPGTGKGFFLNRLAVQLECMPDVSLTGVDKADIALHLTKIKKPGKINVIRYNGIYYNKGAPARDDGTPEYKYINNIISKASRGAHAYIYQSQWAKEMCEKYLTVPSLPGMVILNGDDPDRISPEIDRLGYDHNFLAFSRWRPHKRLTDIIESFLMTGLKNSCLHVAGSLDQSGIDKSKIRMYRRSGVCMHSHLDQNQLMNLIKISTVIHICWLDCCPNSVVESICAGSTVITNNVGGTHELVGPSGGIVCNIDKPFDNNPCFLYKPPKIDRSILSKAMVKASTSEMKINYDHLHIKNIAEQYKKFFEEVISHSR